MGESRSDCKLQNTSRNQRLPSYTPEKLMNGHPKCFGQSWLLLQKGHFGYLAFKFLGFKSSSLQRFFIHFHTHFCGASFGFGVDLELRHLRLFWKVTERWILGPLEIGGGETAFLFRYKLGNIPLYYFKYIEEVGPKNCRGYVVNT